MTTVLIIFLLFFLPFVIWPFGVSPYEGPKVIIAQILIESLLLLYIFNKNLLVLVKGNKLQIIGISGFIILSLIHLILFPTQTSFFGNEFRLQGIFLLWHLLIFSFLSSRIETNKIPNFIYPVSLLSLVATSLVFGWNENGRAIGTLGEPNALASVAIFILPFTYFTQKNIFIKIFCILVSVLIIFLSGSRSGLIAFIIQSLFVLQTQTLKVSISKAFLFSFFLFSITLLLPFIERGGIFENRSMVWTTAFYSGFQSPIIGSGFGNIEQTLHQTSLTLNNAIQYQRVDSSHNFILDFWVQGGLVGLFLITTMLIIAIKNLIINNNNKSLELTVLIGVITVMSFNPVSVSTLVVFWFLVGKGVQQNNIIFS